MAVGKPADEDIEDHDECHAQRGDEEPHLLPLGLPAAHEGTEPADEIEGEERA